MDKDGSTTLKADAKIALESAKPIVESEGDDLEADRHQLWTDPRIMERESYVLRVHFAEMETVSRRSNASIVEYAQFMGFGTLHSASTGQKWDVAVVHFLQVGCVCVPGGITFAEASIKAVLVSLLTCRRR